MISIFLICILIPHLLLAQEPEYSGMSIAVSQDSVKSNYESSLNETCKALPNQFPNAKKIFWDFFSISFEINDIKAIFACTPSISDIILSKNSITITSKDKFFNANMTLKYLFKIFGFKLLYGQAKATYTIGKSNIIQTFNERQVSTDIKFNETLTVDYIDGTLLSSGIKYFISTLLSSNATGIAKNKFKEEFSKKVQIAYDKITTLNPFPKITNLPVRLYNILPDFNKINNFYYVGFKTKVGVDNRPYNKTTYKLIKTIQVKEKLNLEVCVSESLLIGAAEVMGKARAYLEITNLTNIGLSDRLITLIPAMPKLTEIYSSRESLNLGCRPLGDTEILLLKSIDEKSKDRTIQYPITCTFSTNNTGDNLITLNIIFRTNISKTPEPKNQISIRTENTTLYYYSYSSSIVPVEDPISLQYLARAIITIYEKRVLYSKPFELNEHFGEPKNLTHESDQYCFIY